MKNHNTKPVGSQLVLEAHATTQRNHNRRGRGRGRGKSGIGGRSRGYKYSNGNWGWGKGQLKKRFFEWTKFKLANQRPKVGLL